MVDSSEEKPIFGQSNPALAKEHEPWGKDILQWVIGLTIGVLVIYWVIGLTANIVANRISDKQEASWFKGEKIFGMTGFEIDNGAKKPDFVRCQELLKKLEATKKLRKQYRRQRNRLLVPALIAFQPVKSRQRR